MATHVRDLRGVIDREKAEIGVLISMQPPTGTMDKFPRLQILSIAELLEGKKIDYPRYSSDATFKKAPKARKAAEEQMPLGEGEIEEPF